MTVSWLKWVRLGVALIFLWSWLPMAAFWVVTHWSVFSFMAGFCAATGLWNLISFAGEILRAYEIGRIEKQ